MFQNPLRRGQAERKAFQRAQKIAAQMAGTAQTAPLDEVRGDLTEARGLRRVLDALISEAETRVARPSIGSTAVARPAEADWAWRAEAFRLPLPMPGVAPVVSRETLGQGLTVFHDCPLSEITLRQVRNNRSGDTAPFGIVMDVMGFEGSFLSLAVDLPDDLRGGLSKAHLLRISPVITSEKPVEMFARLNIMHGPNTEQLLYQINGQSAPQLVEFDLAYAEFNPGRIDRLWVDLIFDQPAMTQVRISDLTVVRMPRAEV